MNKGLVIVVMFCSIFVTANSAHSISLSEQNYNKGEKDFLRDLPWSKKDPFTRPSFKAKKVSGVSADSGAVRAAKAYEEIEPSTLLLNAIIYSEGSKSAVVNGQIVRIGSVIEEQKVIAIEKEYVKFDFKGKHYNITLSDFINLK